MRRIVLPYLCIFIIGICLYATGIWLLVGAVLAALLFLFLRKNKASYMVLSLFFLLLGYLSMKVNTDIRNSTYKSLQEADYFEGMIYDKQGTAFTLVNRDKGYRIKAYMYGESNVIPGDYVKFNGKIREKRVYEMKSMNASGLDAYVSCQSYAIEKQKAFSLASVPVRIRYKLSEELYKIDSSGGAFISGIVTGQTAGISTNEKEAFSNTGLSHILAVSGFNLGIIFYVVLLFFSKAPKKLRYLICILICLAYVFITGFQPSITRAFIMVCIASLGVFLKKDYDAITAISVSALLMLCYNPYYIYNIGFLLSFAATYGILLLKDDIGDRVPKWLDKIKDETSIAGSAFIATLPIIIYSKGFFSIISIFFNLLVVPFISVMTIGSFICSIFFLILKARIVLYPVVFAGNLMVRLIKFADSINIMVFPGAPSIWFVALYYILLFISFGYINIKRGSRVVKAVLFSMLLILLLHKGHSLRIHMINVGQGDSILMETPGGATVLIDTGPAFSDYTAAESRVVPYIRKRGYNSINVLIITHFHSDHAGGLDYIMKELKVDSIIAYEAPKNENIEYTSVSAGDSISIDGVLLNILYPQSGMDSSGDENECCLVMELVYGEYNMLLTADADCQVMDSLAGEYEVLKLPHHGSSASFSYTMADASQIGTAVVSVGRNSYGHPSREVLDYLSERGIAAYRTDIMGSIIITTNGKSYRIVSQSP